MPTSTEDEFSTRPRGVTYTSVYRDVDVMFRLGLKPAEIENFWQLPIFIQALAITYVKTQDQWEYVKNLEANRNSRPRNSRGRRMDAGSTEVE